MLDTMDIFGLCFIVFSPLRQLTSNRSQVFSTDMFYAAFKKAPMDGVQGRRYRHTVLEKGGSRDEMETLKDFLGREPNSDAFFEDLGLAKK